jgi:D-citramalate synthase
VLQRIIELGDKKHTVNVAELPYIIADVLKTPEDQRVRVATYKVTVGADEKPHARVQLRYNRRSAAASATGDGGYDALMNALRRAARKLDLEVARLEDYRVRIPPGGRTAALVETLITWKSDLHGDGTFSTLGVDSDQLAAAVIATEKMLNALASRSPKKRSGGKRGRS